MKCSINGAWTPCICQFNSIRNDGVPQGILLCIWLLCCHQAPRYNKPIDFKGETTIKVHFMNINSQKKAIKKLNMETNDSIQMVLMFELIKSQGDFNDAISKWGRLKMIDQMAQHFQYQWLESRHQSIHQKCHPCRPQQDSHGGWWDQYKAGANEVSGKKSMEPISLPLC